MVQISVSGKGVKLDIGKKNNSFFDPPPRGLAPTGIPGLYVPPSKPIDPRDCVNWKDSPWCGGNPISKDPLKLTAVPSIDNCGVSLDIQPTILFIKGPHAHITYRYPGSCRSEYEKPDPPPPPPPNVPPGSYKTRGFDPAYASGRVKVIYVVNSDASYYDEDGTFAYREVFQTNCHDFICPGRLVTNDPNFGTYNYDFSCLYDFYGNFSSTGALDAGNTSTNNHYDWKDYNPIVRHQYDYYVADDGTLIQDYSTSSATVTVYDTTKTIAGILQGGSTGNPGVPLALVGDWDLICKFINKHGTPSPGVDIDVVLQHIFNYDCSPPKFLPPPPPPPPDPPDCCMSCCSPSPNQQNSDDALLRQILQIVSENQERIKKTEEVLGIDTYPIQAISGIDQSELRFQTEQDAWQYLLANLSTGGTPANLGKFPFTPQIFDTDPTVRDAQGDSTPVKTVSDALQLVLKQQQVLNKAFGVDQYPAKVPEWMIVGQVNGQDLNNEQKEYKSLTELQEWYFKNIFGIIGQFGVNFELTDTQPGQPNADGTPGDPQTTTTNINLPNIAEAIAEMFGLITHVNLTVESMMNANLRTMLDLGSTKTQAFTTHMYVQALCDYFGFSYEDMTQQMALSFTPGETDLTKLLQETHIDVPGIKYDGKHRFRDNLHDLLKAAAITNAVHYRKFDSATDMAGQLLNHIKNRAQASKDIAEPKDSQGKTDIERFYKEFEVGFEDEAGIDDHTKPYGRPFEQRPIVTKLTEPPAPGTQSPPPTTNPGQ